MQCLDDRASQCSGNRQAAGTAGASKKEGQTVIAKILWSNRPGCLLIAQVLNSSPDRSMVSKKNEGGGGNLVHSQR